MPCGSSRSWKNFRSSFQFFSRPTVVPLRTEYLFLSRLIRCTASTRLIYKIFHSLQTSGALSCINRVELIVHRTHVCNLSCEVFCFSRSPAQFQSFFAFHRIESIQTLVVELRL